MGMDCPGWVWLMNLRDVTTPKNYGIYLMYRKQGKRKYKGV